MDHFSRLVRPNVSQIDQLSYIPHPKIGIYFISSNGSGTTVMVRMGGIVKVLSGIPTAVKMASKVG